MAKEKLLFDKTELVCGILMGNSATVVNVKYSDILSIKFIPTEEKGFLRKVPSEMIEIKCKNNSIYYNKKKANFILMGDSIVPTTALLLKTLPSPRLEISI